MKLLAAIDNFITENIYQKIVDISQKQPTWWMLQSIIAVLVLSILSTVFREVNAFHVIGIILTFCLVIFTHKYSYALLNDGKSSVDYFIKTFLCFMLLTGFIVEINAVNAIGIISDIAMISFIYFSSCKPPATPKKKFSIQPSLQN
jgi:hypothetical protein